MKVTEKEALKGQSVGATIVTSGRLNEKFAIANCIWGLLEDEGEANKGYASFLAMYQDRMSPEAVARIKEIMSEESKHVNILMAMAEQLTGIKPEA